MIEKFKCLLFVLCNMFVGCLAGWLFIYADALCAVFLILIYIVSLALFNEIYK